MAQELVTDYLDQIFRDRRYCSECGAMTPILHPNIPLSWWGVPMEETCEICKIPYGPGLRKLKIKETYGMAIINEGAVEKMIKVVKSTEE